MEIKDYLEYVKYNLGLSTTVRDKYLEKIIEGVISELNNSGISPEGQDESYRKEYENYVISYSAWMYENRGGVNTLPRFLSFRRHNLQIGRKDVE